MASMGLRAIYQKPRTSVPHPEHRKCPYLLRDLIIDRPNHIWCADITYIPIKRGFLYLVTIMDGFTRKVLPWRLSNTTDAEFCIEALGDALWRPRDFQHGLGLTIHNAPFYWAPGRASDPH